MAISEILQVYCRIPQPYRVHSNQLSSGNPSPLAGGGWGEGDHKRKVLRFLILATPTL
jgi:hypothetical protein